MPTKKAKKKAARLDHRGYFTASTPRASWKDGDSERETLAECTLAVRPGGTVRLTLRARVQTLAYFDRSPRVSPLATAKGVCSPLLRQSQPCVLDSHPAAGSGDAPSPRPQFGALASDSLSMMFLLPEAALGPPLTHAKSGSSPMATVPEARSSLTSENSGTSLLAGGDGSRARPVVAAAQCASARETVPGALAVPSPIPDANASHAGEAYGAGCVGGSPLFGSAAHSPTGACLLVGGSAPTTPQMRPAAWPSLTTPDGPSGRAALLGTSSADDTSASSTAQAGASGGEAIRGCCDGCVSSAALLPDAELAVRLAELPREEEEGERAAECTIEPEEEEGIMCAICHCNIQALDVALVHGCDHPFCCNCILNWALQRQRCPLCQLDFTHLWMYKQLDGTFNDYLREESVALLHRAVWFRKAIVTEFSPHAHVDDDDEYHDFLQYEYGGSRDEVSPPPLAVRMPCKPTPSSPPPPPAARPPCKPSCRRASRRRGRLRGATSPTVCVRQCLWPSATVRASSMRGGCPSRWTPAPSPPRP